MKNTYNVLAILALKLTNMTLTKKEINLHKSTARKLKKSEQRKYKAEITNMYLKGNTLEARRVFGWFSKTIELGQHELRTGIECLGFCKNSGRDKLEDKFPKLSKDIEDLVKNDISADNKLQSTFKFCRLSIDKLYKKLINEKGYTKEDFKPRGLNNVMNRLGYSLKKT